MLDYLEAAGADARIWSVSPQDEHTWPADESVLLEGKIIGLQFKRPYMAALAPGQTVPHYRQLHWPLNRDPSQFNMVKAADEIFYCLPTFVNRLWRKRSLHHCLFWRPTRRMGPRDVWYDIRHRTNRWYGSIDRHYNSYRWGAFFERIQQCDFGWKVNSPGPVHDYHEHLRSAIQAAELIPVREGEREQLLFLNISMEMQERAE